MKTQQRLGGIDLFRGIAIFAVILLHADEGIMVSPDTWQYWLNFAEFAVPFFLATSFWLAGDKAECHNFQHSWLKNRVTRLGKSYLVWSFIYLSYKGCKYAFCGELENWQTLLASPLVIMFEGGAAFHLYFLPLLILGTILFSLFAIPSSSSTRIEVLMVLNVVSLAAYQLCIWSNDSLKLTESSSISGVAWTWAFWGIRCLPYIAIAKLLNHPILKPYCSYPTKFKIYLWLGLFLAVNLIGSCSLESLHEVLRGYSALMLAIFVSQYRFCLNWLTLNLSRCSFGIYLIHLIFVDVGQIIEQQMFYEPFRSSTINLLLFTVICFVISWIAIEVLMRDRRVTRIIF